MMLNHSRKKLSGYYFKQVLKCKHVSMELQTFLGLTRCVKFCCSGGQEYSMSLGIISVFSSIDSSSPWFLSTQTCQGPPAVIWMTEPHVEASCRVPDRDNSALHSPWWSYTFSDKRGNFFYLTLSWRKFYSSQAMIVPLVCLRVHGNLC